MEGNKMSFRTALETLRNRFNHDVMVYQDRYFKFSGWHWHKKAAEAARWRDVFAELKDVCDSALSAPVRNCDRAKDAAEELFKERFGRPWTQAEDELATWLFSQSEGGAR